MRFFPKKKRTFVKRRSLNEIYASLDKLATNNESAVPSPKTDENEPKSRRRRLNNLSLIKKMRRQERVHQDAGVGQRDDAQKASLEPQPWRGSSSTNGRDYKGKEIAVDDETNNNVYNIGSSSSEEGDFYQVRIQEPPPSYTVHDFMKVDIQEPPSPSPATKTIITTTTATDNQQFVPPPPAFTASHHEDLELSLATPNQNLGLESSWARSNRNLLFRSDIYGRVQEKPADVMLGQQFKVPSRPMPVLPPQIPR